MHIGYINIYNLKGTAKGGPPGYTQKGGFVAKFVQICTVLYCPAHPMTLSYEYLVNSDPLSKLCFGGAGFFFVAKFVLLRRFVSLEIAFILRLDQRLPQKTPFYGPIHI